MVKVTSDNKFARDYSLTDAEIVSARGIKLAEPPRFAVKYGSETAYEPVSLSLWQNLVRPGDIVADIGAHHGIYSLLAARGGQATKVFAYEPAKANLAILINNVKLNNLSRIIVPRHVALADKPGWTKFQITEASDNANIQGHPNSPTLKTEKVRLSTLDIDFAKSKLDLLKIDTDGYEPYILDGAKATFQHNPQLRILIELNPKCLRRNRFNPLKFLERLVGLKFELYLIDDFQHTVAQITKKQSAWPEIIKTPYFYNILCLPSHDRKSQQLLKRTVRRLQSERVITKADLSGGWLKLSSLFRNR